MDPNFEIVDQKSRDTLQGRVTATSKLNFPEIKHRLDVRKNPRLRAAYEQVYPTSEVSEEIFIAYPMELGLSNIKENKTSGAAGTYQVFTSLNGYTVPKSEAKKNGSAYQAMANNLRFAGVVSTKAVYSERPDGREDHTLQIGGVTNIINNSRERIHPMDLLLFKIPDAGIADNQQRINSFRGEPRNKIVAEIEKYKPEKHAMSTERVYNKFFEIINEMKDPTKKAPVREQYEDSPDKLAFDLVELAEAATSDDRDKTKQKIALILRELRNHEQMINNRVVGRALSSAKPNDICRILVGYYSL